MVVKMDKNMTPSDRAKISYFINVWLLPNLPTTVRFPKLV